MWFEASGSRRPLVWGRMVGLLWKDVLVFAFVALAVAGSVAFLGVRLEKLGRFGGVDVMPDVIGQRCSDRASKGR
jgi:hypothetical protein